MAETVNEQQNKKKPLRRKYILVAGIVFLLVIFALVFSLLQEPKPDPDSEYTIRKLAAESLQKDPNELTDEDFAKITHIPNTNFSHLQYGSVHFKYGGVGIMFTELSDIRLLSKFTNLQVLDLGIIVYPTKKNPKWMSILSKLGIRNSYEKFYIDLSPLEKIYSLEEICIGGPIKSIKPLKNLVRLRKLDIKSSILKDIKPIEKLTNLQSLVLASPKLSDIKSLRQLSNLESLSIRETNISSITPLSNLTKLTSLSIYNSPVGDLTPIAKLENIQTINLTNTQVRDIQPLANLVNLRMLTLLGSQISNLEPLKELNHLRYLDIRELPITSLEPLKNLNELNELIILNCVNITDQEIEDLQIALPNLKIENGK